MDKYLSRELVQRYGPVLQFFNKPLIKLQALLSLMSPKHCKSSEKKFED